MMLCIASYVKTVLVNYCIHIYCFYYFN